MKMFVNIRQKVICKSVKIRISKSHQSWVQGYFIEKFFLKGKWHLKWHKGKMTENKFLEYEEIENMSFDARGHFEGKEREHLSSRYPYKSWLGKPKLRHVTRAWEFQFLARGSYSGSGYGSHDCTNVQLGLSARDRNFRSLLGLVARAWLASREVSDHSLTRGVTRVRDDAITSWIIEGLNHTICRSSSILFSIKFFGHNVRNRSTAFLNENRYW